MIDARKPNRPEQPFLDDLSRRLASATSRRDAVRVVLTMMFGSSFAAACTGTTEPCTSACKGSNGSCYSCSSGSHCSQSGGSGCSTGTNGVYCCYDSSSGGTSGSATCPCSRGYTYNFSSRLCCPSSTPNYYPGTHGIKPAGCYATCPYVGDCGTTFQNC